MSTTMDTSPVRIDKWMWAARLVKTRSLAVDAIRGGRVKVNGAPAKPSKDVKPGDEIEFSQGVIRMTATHQRDGRAAAARQRGACTCTRRPRPRASEREQRVAEMKMTRPQGVDRNARPTKRDRRQFEKLRGRDDLP